MKKRIHIGIVFAAAFPTVFTLIYFLLLAENSGGIQQITYAAGKIIQFTFPLWWLTFFIKKSSSYLSRPIKRHG